MSIDRESEDNLESFTAKSWRHFNAGQLDPSTLRSGLNQLFDEAVLRREAEAQVLPPVIAENYLGVEGLTVADYMILIPAQPGLNMFTGRDGYARIKARIYEFPQDTALRIFVTPPSYNIHTRSFYRDVPGAIASFTGPTFMEKTGGLPNNGFYSRESDNCLVPFEQVPKGQRRGAFGLTSEGSLELVADERKLVIVAGGFKGYDFLVGTGNYFAEEDAGSASTLPIGNKSHLSYLAQYLRPDGSSSFCFSVVRRMISRKLMRTLLKDYGRIRPSRLHMAVELEYSGADCVVVGSQGRSESYTGWGYENRRDHYVMVR